LNKYIKNIRKFCYAAICVALLMICFDAVSIYILTDYDTAKANHDRKDFSRAFRLFIKLAKQGDKRAQYYIGRMYHLGEGRAQDRQEAVRWYRMSVAQDFARAENNLGILLLEQGNVSEAVILFQKAASQGLPQAKTNLEGTLKLDQRALQKQLSSARRTVSKSQQNMNDPSMEFSYRRFRQGLQ
jgi:uncharacterized protein